MLDDVEYRDNLFWKYYRAEYLFFAWPGTFNRLGNGHRVILKEVRCHMIAIWLLAGMIGFLSFEQTGWTFEDVKYVRDIKGALARPVDVAVAVNGDVYCLDQEAGKVFVFDSTGKPKLDFGKEGDKAGQFDDPRSIALSPTGNVFIADTGNDRIQAFDKSGTFLYEFGSSGEQAGKFRGPEGIAIDSFGLIFVADRGNRRIQAFSNRGIFLTLFPTQGSPTDVSLDPQRNLYVLLSDAPHLLKFDQERNASLIRGGLEKVRAAGGLAVDMRGDIYVTDESGESVKKIDPKGSLLVSFGSEGDGRGQFDNPQGVGIDREGQIYIADSRNSRVQVLKISGSPKPFMTAQTQSPPIVEFDSFKKAEKGISDLIATPGDNLYLLSRETNRAILMGATNLVFGKSGSKPGQFENPEALSVGTNGKVFVADSGNHRAQVLGPDGSYEYDFGKRGTKTGQFSRPSGIAVNSKGLIYLADTENNRIQIFNSDAIFLKAFGQRSKVVDDKNPEEGNFNAPTALAVDSKNQVYVLDSGNHRIQVFSEEGQFLRVIGKQGKKVGEFFQPVDISIDGDDYLYVADRGNHRIQVFHPEGPAVFVFGSPKEESVFGFSFGESDQPSPGTFAQLSGVAASQGKIYVADYDSDHIQVFRFYPQGLIQAERLYVTKSAYPPHDVPGEDGRKAAKSAAIQQAIQELSRQTGISIDQTTPQFRIDSEETLTTGQVQVTVSVPKPKTATGGLATTETSEPAIFQKDPNRLFVTQSAFPPPEYKDVPDKAEEMAGAVALGNALKDLFQQLGRPLPPISEEMLEEEHIRIESKETLSTGAVQVTVSMPKSKGSIQKKDDHAEQEEFILQ